MQHTHTHIHTHTHACTHARTHAGKHARTHTHTHTHTDLLLVSQLHNAAQLSSWCLHFISSNYVEFESKDEFQRLSGSNLDYVQEHRWPPLSHEAAVEEYQRKYLSKELQGSSKEKGIVKVAKAIHRNGIA